MNKMKFLILLTAFVSSFAWAENPKHSCGSDFDVAFADQPVQHLLKKRASSLTAEEGLDLIKYKRIKQLHTKANQLIREAELLPEGSVKRDAAEAEITAICVEVAGAE